MNLTHISLIAVRSKQNIFLSHQPYAGNDEIFQRQPHPHGDDEEQVHDVERGEQENPPVGARGQPDEGLQREEDVTCDVKVVQDSQRLRKEQQLLGGECGAVGPSPPRSSERVHCLQGKDDDRQHHEDHIGEVPYLGDRAYFSTVQRDYFFYQIICYCL